MLLLCSWIGSLARASTPASSSRRGLAHQQDARPRHPQQVFDRVDHVADQAEGSAGFARSRCRRPGCRWPSPPRLRAPCRATRCRRPPTSARSVRFGSFEAGHHPVADGGLDLAALQGDRLGQPAQVLGQPFEGHPRRHLRVDGAGVAARARRRAGWPARCWAGSFAAATPSTWSGRVRESSER